MKALKDGQIASGRHLGKLLTFLSPLALTTQCVIHTLCMFQSELNNRLKYFLEQKQITNTKRQIMFSPISIIDRSFLDITRFDHWQIIIIISYNDEIDIIIINDNNNLISITWLQLFQKFLIHYLN